MQHPLSNEEKIKTMQWIASSENNEELAERYDSIAETWDDNTSDYLTPQNIASRFTAYVQNNAKILDAGCGTGIIGELLSKQGYNNIEGFDLSAGMLKKAANKGYYIALSRQALGEPLTFPDNNFDAVILSGVFLKGHAPSSSFDELIRITKVNGYIIFTLRSELYDDNNSDYKKKMSALETEKYWKLVESDVFQVIPGIDQRPKVASFVYQVIKHQ